MIIRILTLGITEKPRLPEAFPTNNNKLKKPHITCLAQVDEPINGG
jgi:hypothetical protein